MRYILTILIVLVTISCSSKDNSTHIEVVDGVEIVHNSELPAESGKLVKFTKEYTIDTENDNLFSITGYAVNQKGSVFINDLRNNRIVLYNPAGEFIKYVGREGAGPGEYSFINKMDVLPDGKMIINDQGVQFNIYDADGNFIKKIKTLGFTSKVLGGKTDYYLISDSSYIDFSDHDKKRELKEFCEFRFNGDVIRKIYTDEVEVINADESSSRIQSINDYVFDPVNLVLYKFKIKSKDFSLEAIDINGKTIRKISRPYTPVRYTQEEIDKKKKYYEDLAKKYPGMGLDKTEISTTKKVLQKITVDEKGNLWVRTNEVKTENETKQIAYDIINPEGIYQYRFWINKNEQPHSFKNGKMYSLTEEEETGLKTLSCYKMEIN